MELQIDTSALNQSNKLIYKLEETTLKQLKEFTLNNIKQNANEFLNIRENYLIKVDYFLIERFSQISLIIYGEIIENNQTVFDWNKSDKVFVYVKNPNIIKEIISRIINQKNFQIRIEIEECTIIKYSKLEKMNKNLIFFIMLYVSSILKIFFSMKKFKFNKWENILISSKFYQESFLLKKILNMIGYSVNIHSPKSNKEIDPDIFEKAEVSFDSSEENKFKFFNFLIETSACFYENKLKFLNCLKNEGNIILISVDQEINTDYDQNKVQFDPRDIEVMQKKSLGLNICNLKNIMHFTLSKGRELNFVNEILDKLLKSEEMGNINEPEWERLVERFQVKIFDKSYLNYNLKEKKIEEILNSSINISLIILNNNE